jgi:hypothetical protein
MKILVSMLALTVVGIANADMLVSEVVDGDLPGGNPKFVELTNTGDSDVTFGVDDFVQIYFNGGTEPNTTVALDGITIVAGDSFVIASTANGGVEQFQAAYGFDADLYSDGFFGNGDDAYTLEDVGGVVDTYGVVGVDGTGEVWEYRDSYAFRNFPITMPNDVFADTEWTFGGVGALDAATDEERIALLQEFTTPGSHNFVPEPGSLALLAFGLLGVVRRR